MFRYEEEMVILRRQLEAARGGAPQPAIPGPPQHGGPSAGPPPPSIGMGNNLFSGIMTGREGKAVVYHHSRLRKNRPLLDPSIRCRNHLRGYKAPLPRRRHLHSNPLFSSLTRGPLPTVSLVSRPRAPPRPARASVALVDLQRAALQLRRLIPRCHTLGPALHRR